MAQSIGVPSEGGLTVEQKLASVVNGAVELKSVALQLGLKVGLGQSEMRVASVLAPIEPSLHAEAAIANKVDAEYSSVDLDLGGNYLAHTLISNELLEDSVDSFSKSIETALSSLASKIDQDMIASISGDVDVTAAGASVGAITLENVADLLGSVDDLDSEPVLLAGRKVAAKIRSLCNGHDPLNVLGVRLVHCNAYKGNGTGEAVAGFGYLSHKLAVSFNEASHKLNRELYAINDQSLLHLNQRVYGGHMSPAGSVWATLTLA